MGRRRGVDEHQQRLGGEHVGHTAVPGAAVVHQEPDARVDERGPGAHGDQRFVLQLHMHDHQRDRAERRGRRQRVQDVQDVRRHMPDRPRGHHNGVRRQRSQSREDPGSRTVLVAGRVPVHRRRSRHVVVCHRTNKTTFSVKQVYSSHNHQIFPSC